LKRHSKKAAPVSSSLRIIAGDWRGRKLPIVTSDGLRPTGDRLRETLFNWLAPWLPGSRCLDLFAGSGALAFEALSRGAASATMLESHREVVRQLRANCTTLATPKADIIEADALSWLNRERQSDSAALDVFDLVFVDPPFAADLWQKAVDLLEERQWLADHASIYVETPKDLPLHPPSNWVLRKRKTTGAVSAQLFVRRSPSQEKPPQKTGHAKAG
jgi:16S rRNA (guanine966-N2)-methyltransferase